MKHYIATFYAHFGAIRFKKELGAQGTEVTLMPVPRALSSSCGTCGAFTAEELPTLSHRDEVEQIVTVEDDNRYQVVFSTLND